MKNGYIKFKCSSYSKYGKIPGKGCDNKSFSENALYSILQSLSEQIVEVNTAEVRKSLLNWLESLRERLRASQGDDTIKEEIRKQTANVPSRLPKRAVNSRFTGEAVISPARSCPTL